MKNSSKSTPKVLDTFLRALQRLADLGQDVEALEAELSDREKDTLERLLELVEPLLPMLVGPIPLREPWLMGEGGQGKPADRWTEEGLILGRKFQNDRSPDDGSSRFRSTMLLLDARGRLVEVEQTARWREGREPGREAVWRVESREVALTRKFARENLRRILGALLESLRDRLKREVEHKKEILDRLQLVEDASRALGVKGRTTRLTPEDVEARKNKGSSSS